MFRCFEGSLLYLVTKREYSITLYNLKCVYGEKPNEESLENIVLRKFRQSWDGLFWLNIEKKERINCILLKRSTYIILIKYLKYNFIYGNSYFKATA